MVNKRRLAIGVPLLVLTGIAAQVTYTSKVAGNMVAANWDGGPIGNINVTPADTPDGTAYSVFWRGCTLNPDLAHRYCLWAAGLASKSAIKTSRTDMLELVLDVSKLTVIFFSGGEDCRSGTCVPLVPPSVPLNGTFTVYSGPGSFTEQSNGSSQRTSILPLPASGFTSQAFSGSKSLYSANFIGIVGPATVTPTPGVANAQLTIMKGQQTYQTVYSVYPVYP